jgi:hypothetical protein
MRGSEPVGAGGAGGTVAEFKRARLECDPAALSRIALVLERDGLTDPVLDWLRWLPDERDSTPVSVGNRLPMSWANCVGWKRAA